MSLDLKPSISKKEAGNIALELFGIRGQLSLLPGERDQNFLVTAEGNKKYVLKIVNGSENYNFLKAEAQMLEHLGNAGCRVPSIIKSTKGHLFEEVNIEGGGSNLVWILSFLEGKLMGELAWITDKLLYEEGFELGRIDKCLEGFDNESFSRRFDWDLQFFPDVVEKYTGYVKKVELLDFINNTLLLYRSRVVPLAGKLRKSIIQNDANDYNLVVKKEDDHRDELVLSGIIDFGDSVYSYTVANLAVMIAYIILDKPDPLVSAGEVLKGYNVSYELLPEEVEVLYTMIRMRLSVSICMAAWQQEIRPDDDYLSISQAPIMRSVERLEKVNPDMAEAFFRLKCGMQQNEKHLAVSKYLLEYGKSSFPVLGKAIEAENSKVLDLSVDSELISGDYNRNSEHALTPRIENELRSSGVAFGIGRYDEPRILYNSPLFAGSGFSESEDRTIHLGIDLFSDAGQPVFAPLDGIVYSVSYNPDPLDYGNVLIIKHHTDLGQPFYSLYGHLGRESVAGRKQGDMVKSGEKIAETGVPGENGGWTPHLHFQLISDIPDLKTDFPGVCTPSEKEAWKIISPDPNLLLGIPGSLFPGYSPRVEITLGKRNKLIGTSLKLGYNRPVKMARGWMQYMFDANGQKYLDGYNNVPHVGHCHPEVTGAAALQMRKLNTNTRYLYDNLNDYAEMLLSTFPAELDTCFFLNSGSEANELALRLAFTYTGQKDTVVLEGAYHGNTTTMIDISPYKHDGPGGQGSPLWVHKVEVADCYRGRFKYDDPDAGEKYAAIVSSAIREVESEGRGLAAFIAETCPSVGGQIIFPEGYLSTVYRHVRKNGGLCIADEVQTAYGRMGSNFYAFQDQGVVPDIVVLGKPIGNGHPLAAVVTTSAIAAAFDNGMEFFSTFGGNSVSSAIGMKVLEIALRDNLMDHASRTGSYLIERLKNLKDKYHLIGDVRGSGLFIGLELVRSRETLEPAGWEASWISNRMRDNRILIGTDGPFHNVLKIRPPMPFGKTDADIMADKLDEIFRQIMSL